MIDPPICAGDHDANTTRHYDDLTMATWLAQMGPELFVDIVPWA